MFLTTTTALLQAITDQASDIEVAVDWMDKVAATEPVGGNTNTASITTATTTTVCGSPAASTLRKIKRMSAHNNHATQSCLLRFVRTDGTTTEEVIHATLLPAETLLYTEDGEWKHYDSDALLKLPTSKLDVCLYVTANSVHATAATWASITGLTQAVKAGIRYTFDACLFHINNDTTTGSQFGIGGVTMTSMIIGAISTVTNSPTAATMSTGVASAVDTAAVVQTTGPAANAPTRLSGSFVPSADGTFAVRATSEVTVANGLIVLAGSWVRIRQVDN